ncbi:MAG: site-2 protease family protein [Patescibacteria group bacterium]
MDISFTIFFVIVIIFSAIIHEYSHGWMADQLGDPTARYAGRLTLNPIAHVDLFGSIILPLIMIPTGMLFAYAKPVPYNPYNLKDQKWGPVWVAIAGPASNLVLAFIFGLVLRFLPVSNLSIFLFIIVYANVMLAIFNLAPIPPLDGSKLLFALLPDSMSQVKAQLQQYGWVILLLFIFVGFQWISPIIKYLTGLFTGGAMY